MTNIIVILVIAAFVLLGVKSTIKHFKGENGAVLPIRSSSNQTGR